MTTRRKFLHGVAALAAASALPFPAVAQAKPKVVIIGGGPGGLSVLRTLAAMGHGRFDITLVEPQTVYTTCFYSNLYLGGFQSLDVLQHDYVEIAKLPGVTHARDRAGRIDRDKKLIRLEGGESLPYDRLVVSPGISLDYGSVPGWSKEAETKMPHGWIAGEQTQILKRQLDSVPDGGLIVVVPPPNPYRCPPGPYERVSMMAHALKSSGRENARIVIVDPKDKFSKQALFQQAWEKYYPGMIEWLPPMINGGIRHVDPDSMTVETGFEAYRNADLVNVIPAQSAGRIAIDAGLASGSGYCAIDPFTMKSRADSGIFVLGDACIAGDMPKSAYAANSQGKATGLVLVAELDGNNAPEPGYRNKCWSLVGAGDSVFVSGAYKPTPEKIEQVESGISTPEDSSRTRRANYEDSGGWYAGLTSELFG